MKLTTFKIRGLTSNSKDRQTEDRNESHSKDARIEELFLGVRKMIEDSINKGTKFNEFEARDRHVLVQNNKFSDGKFNPDQIEAWMGKVCRDVMSTAYHYYLTEQMDYSQTKVYCCQGILKNISQFVSNNKEEITPKFYTCVDNILKSKILPYLQLKYPPSISNSVNKRLDKIFKEINNMEVITNDFFYNSDITLQYRESGVYNDLIMQVINQIIKIADTNAITDKAEGDTKTNFEDFEEFMSGLFEKVYDQEWMINGNYKETSKMNQANDKTTEKEEKERQRYKEEVKDYTHYLTGRKIPENVQEFDQFQIKSGFINIKSPTILRIITKWCEQLWDKFDNQNYYIDRAEGLTMLKGKQVNVVYPWLKSVLKQQMAQQKENIVQYMKNIQLNNYDQQFSIMKNEQIMTQASFIDLHEKICGKFSLKVVNNLQNYITVYLNRLIHGLMTVSKSAYKLKLEKKPSWPQPPNLLSFKVGDLLRCKCSSKQRQVLRIFEQMQQISEKTPQKLKIIRIKNRLKLGTNDILINVRYNNCITAEIQLHAQSKHSQSQSSLYAYNFSHLIYEIERSYFGPISEMCSIWANLDPRIKIFRRLIGQQKPNSKNSLQRQSYCLKNSQDHLLVVADNSPFICSECWKAFSNNNYVVPHQKCTKCKYWKCAQCTIKQKYGSDLIELVIQDEQIRASCKPLRCRSLPTYSVGSLVKSRLKEIFYFKIVEAFEKKYLFKIINNQKQQLFKQLSTGKSIKQFLDDYIIFELKPEFSNKFPKKHNIIAFNEQILPAYVKKCFKHQKQTLSLNWLRQFETKPQDLSKMFESPKQHKKYIKFIELSNCNIEQVDFLSYDFTNLELLNINVNNIKDLQYLAGFTKLHTLFATQNKLSSFPVQMCYLQLKYLSLFNNKITQLPAEFCKLKSLEFLKISKNMLTALPENFGDLENLKEIYASINKITNIESLNCPKLEYIELNNNELTVLPKQIQTLTNLTYLSLKENKIKTIQVQFEKLKKLKSFAISKHELAIIPANVQKAPSLTYLNISFSNFNCLDLSGEHFALLKEIDFSNDKIVEVKGIECLKNIQILKLNNNNLSTLPEDICKLSNLKSLVLNNNPLTQLPQRIGELYTLKDLQIKQNQLTTFPPSFFKLKLQNLNFSKNNFCILQTELMSMKSLKTLEFESNQIESLPNAIGSLQNLQFLNFSLNKIQQLPDEISSLKKLKKLLFKGLPLTIFPPFLLNFCTDFNSSKIKALAQNIPRLQNVNQLNLDNNQIENIPNSIAQISNLKKLSLNNNMLMQICEGIFDLPLLTTLSMRNNRISFMPNKFHKLTQLKSLLLHDNKIQQIPDSLETHLKNGLHFEYQSNPITFIPEWFIKYQKKFSKHQLHLSVFKLKRLPDQIPNAQRFTEVFINSNKLKEFPPSLNQCSNLMNLGLANNLIENLQNTTFNFPQLKQLNLSYNKIKEIPQCISLLKKLTILSIKNNPLIKLPQSFKQIQLQTLSIDLSCFEDLSKSKSLQWIHTDKLQFSQKNLLALPQSFGQIGYLQQFSITEQLIKTLPESFSNLRSLTKLQIQCKKFQSLPENIGNLSKLENIQISNCILSKLPDSFWKLSNLKEMHIFRTQLQTLSEKIGDLVLLQVLMVGLNKLTKLPNSISSLTNLETFGFRVNKITQFPAGISKCQQLRYIYAQSNQIKVIPKEMQELKKVQKGELYLDNNPLQKIQCMEYIIERGDEPTKQLAMWI